MPRTGFPTVELILRDVEREQLLRWSRRAKSSQTLALRSGIVLGCGEGLDSEAVAEPSHCLMNTVSKWRARFVQDRLDGLVDDWNENPKPLLWTKPAEQILESLSKHLQRPNGLEH